MQRQMMFALHGRPSDVEVFKFVLAEKLHKSVAELEACMDVYEYAQWQAFTIARNAVESVR